MEYSEAKLGRIFTLRLEDGDRLPDTIEAFARSQEIEAAILFFLGGADKDSEVVVGPEDGTASRPQAILTALQGTHEALGIGTIFLNEDEVPKLHLHSSFGRGEESVTGCTREGVDIWQIGEVVLLELVGSAARREVDPETGFEILEL
jgi:predicted DNA-binding protein with PD1-like motif